MNGRKALKEKVARLKQERIILKKKNRVLKAQLRYDEETYKESSFLQDQINRACVLIERLEKYVFPKVVFNIGKYSLIRKPE